MTVSLKALSCCLSDKGIIIVFVSCKNNEC
nr:MAG TPA: hypothetical protein [Caudoviricetes sp.]DAU09357.1 MAG TPA: hypothetical protein [Caudoviricetes sp.]